MIRFVLAAVLSSALLGVSLPVAERAERDRNAALAVDELESLDDRAERLAADNDPVSADDHPAAATVELAPPSPAVTEGGSIVVHDDLLVWAPVGGANRTVDPSVSLRVEGPILVTEPTRLRLSLVEGEGAGDGSTGFASGDADAVVRVDRPRVQEG